MRSGRRAFTGTARLVLLLGCAALAQAAQFPVHQPVPGGVAVIKLSGVHGEFSARYGRRPILVFEDDGAWFAVVGLDLDTPLGNYLITVRGDSDEPATTRDFTVVPFSYPLKHGVLHGVRQDRLPELWRPQLDTDFPLLYPVAKGNLEPFGTRYVEGGHIVPAQSVMLRAPEPTDVVAPGGGVVAGLTALESGAFYMIIDHGMSLYSSLGPILEPRREAGQAVQQGEILGRFDPDRSDSRTLNWQLALNGVNVNPLLFTEGGTTSGKPPQP